MLEFTIVKIKIELIPMNVKCAFGYQTISVIQAMVQRNFD